MWRFSRLGVKKIDEYFKQLKYPGFESELVWLVLYRNSSDNRICSLRTGVKRIEEFERVFFCLFIDWGSSKDVE